MTPTSWLVVLLQVISQTAMVVPVGISSIIALELLGSQSGLGLATAPSSGTMLATTLMILLLPRTITTLGYKGSFIVGNAMLVLGGLLGYNAIQHANVMRQNHFWLFVLAHVCMGFASSFMQQYRFVAADAAKNSNTAISWILSAGIVAAIVGPWISDHAKPYPNSYLAIAGLGLLGIVGVAFLKLPSNAASSLSRAAIRLKDITPALSYSATGYVAMVLMMTATPLMMSMCGLQTASSNVIRWHLLGMFVPSLITGRFKFSSKFAAKLGVVLLVAQAAVAVSGRSYGHFWWSLLLLGVSWNLMYLAGTRVLSELTSNWNLAQQTSARALHDFLLFAMVSIASLSSGPLLKHIHWEGMALLTLLPVCALGYRLFWPKKA